MSSNYRWYFASKYENVELELGAMMQFLLTICWWFKTVLCPIYSVKWQLSTEYSMFAFKVKIKSKLDGHLITWSIWNWTVQSWFNQSWSGKIIWFDMETINIHSILILEFHLLYSHCIDLNKWWYQTEHPSFRAQNWIIAVLPVA